MNCELCGGPSDNIIDSCGAISMKFEDGICPWCYKLLKQAKLRYGK